MILRQVGRSFEADGVRHETGDIVDVTGWPRVQRLQALRYLLPAPKNTEGPSKVSSGSSGGDVTPPAAKKTAAPAAKKAPAKPAAKKATAPRKKAPAKKATPAVEPAPSK